MPEVKFEDLSQSLVRLPELIKSIPDTLRNPAANPLQASILLGTGLVLIMIVVLSVVLLVMRPSAEEEALYSAHEDAEEYEPISEEEQRELDREERKARWASRTTVTAIVILVATAVLLVMGFTSGQSDVCSSCHLDTKHSVAGSADPHKSVACVQCHEGGGQFARLSVNVFTRLEHVVLSRTNPKAAADFGMPIASDACYSCHKDDIRGVFYDKTLRVKVRHAEPLAAGAQCVDCHTLKSGMVSSRTTGMSPCLRCHDGHQAKAECSECHEGDPSEAIVPSVGPGEMAASRVPNPQCSGCHKDMTKCDACHGIRMPHSDVFKRYAHARDAAIDIWYGSGTKCQKCHYQGHNNCVSTGCHGFPVALGHPNPAWGKLHQANAWDTNPSAPMCSCHRWNPYDHDGMIYCQICHDVKPKGAREGSATAR